MAEVLGKANLFMACNYSQKKNQEFSRKISGFCLINNTLPSLKMKSQAPRSCFNGKRVVFLEKKSVNDRSSRLLPLKAQMQTGLIGKTQKWWEKELQPNMKEVTSAQDLVDSLLNAGDQLVIVDFFSPGCGGCKALHPKIGQLAEMNPDVQFLQVNYEEHKSMCYSLNVHVLPFFRFYRGAQGRLCSFSCTNATIKKFRDALAKHKPDRCSLGPTKGLEEKELLALAANKDLSFNYAPKPVPDPEKIPASEEKLPTSVKPKESEKKTLVGTGR
ncbi:Thioredoxin-like 1-1 [Hibiscus syriacus]|uniref:Thioredoxin-like 1-1 n=1 Tax=Hibiscus syriacus TaxID=106335 RepID=A0A6A3BZS3_HIBSY|nr:thioredoxin-like 1-1, chloroplastic [Hibiscus syriacus]KAE8722285.1 Thioredoxin-like 1-1 [Hibiscus syriacus]